MKNFMERALNAGRKYTLLDFAVFKLTLFSLGILAGIYFTQFFSGYVALIWVIFAVSYLWIMYRTFFKYM